MTIGFINDDNKPILVTFGFIDNKLNLLAIAIDIITCRVANYDIKYFVIGFNYKFNFNFYFFFIMCYKQCIIVMSPSKNKLKFGLHINPNDMQYYKDKYNITACQIFIFGPRSTHRTKINTQEIKHMAKINKISIWVHSSYMTTLSNSAYAKKLLIDELTECKAIGAKGLVVHLPKLPPEDIIDQLKKITKLKLGRIILEMRACKPDATTYESPEKINNLIIQMKKAGLTKRDVAICLDTAHIYSTDHKQNINNYHDAKIYLDKIKYPSWIALWHANGSHSTTHSDIHAVPFSTQDYIWHKYNYQMSGFRAFVEWSSKNKIHSICEINIDKNSKSVSNLFNLLDNN